MTSPAKLSCLVLLALVLAAASAGSADASQQQPEYGMCSKAAKVGRTFTGGFNDKACTQPNADGEGKYRLAPVKTPYGFLAAVKPSVFYYRAPKGGVVWQVKCPGTEAKGVITGPATSAETMILESCVAKDVAAAGKALHCGHVVVAVETALVELLPGGAPGLLVYPGFAKAFTCESVTFGQMVGFEVGAVEDTGKGPLASLTVNPATGEPTLGSFYDFEEHEPFTASLESEVSGSSPPVLEVGLQAAIPLAASKELVVVRPAS
jgi:hypothetical protein